MWPWPTISLRSARATDPKTQQADAVEPLEAHERRSLEFTSIGDTVNTAARVEAVNKELGTDVLVTDAAAACLPVGACEPRQAITLRGRTQPTMRYTPPRPASDDPPRRGTPAPAVRR